MRERAWINRILAGDKRAGEQLVTENYRRVYGLLRSLTAREDIAADLTQQTFTRAWAGLAGFRGEARLSTWICRIAYHEYAHWRRDAREYQPLIEAESIPDPRAAAGLRTVLFAAALQQLSDDLRETFLLHYEQDLEIKEIAVVLEIPPGTVKSRLFTARNRLRELLSDEEAESEPESALTVPSVTQPFVVLEETLH